MSHAERWLLLLHLTLAQQLNGSRYRFSIYKSRTPLSYKDARDRCEVKRLQLARKDDLTQEDHYLVKKSLKKGTKYWFEDCHQLSPNGVFKQVKCNKLTTDEPTTFGYICETENSDGGELTEPSWSPLSFLDWHSVLKLIQGESSWQGWLSAVTLIIYITWGIAGLLAIILLIYMLVDRFDGGDEDEQNGVGGSKCVGDIPVNSLSTDLEQLKNDIDAYIDRSAKLNKRTCLRRFHCSGYEAEYAQYDLRLVKSMAVQLYRINQLVGNRKDEFIQSLMDRIADLELTELAGNQELDVCDLVSKLSQYLKRLNSAKKSFKDD